MVVREFVNPGCQRQDVSLGFVENPQDRDGLGEWRGWCVSVVGILDERAATPNVDSLLFGSEFTQTEVKSREIQLNSYSTLVSIGLNRQA
jgi:hypothetical protein